MAQQRQMSLRTKMVAAMVGLSVVTAQNDVGYIDAIVPHLHAIEMSEAEATLASHRYGESL